MQSFLTVKGMVLKVEPHNEYDRKMVILTLEKGKITVYARGARKVNSPFAAASNAFTFGTFKLFVHPNSYSLEEVEVVNYFAELRGDMKSALYGMYFLEIADYYARENNDEKDMLKLLYQSVAALKVERLSKPFVRAVYELKVVMVNGEFRGIDETSYLPGTAQAINYLMNCPADKVYTFQVNDDILNEMIQIAKKTCDQTFERKQFMALMLIEDNDKL